ncbi:MAG TPA: lysophospholipase [Verrucomicrobiae bacterium]|nr:lysophospholipase [Verrucomicrobiae bacterium]
MNHTTGHFEGKDGIRLACRSWLPEEPLRAVVLIVHGIAEHCGRYADITAPLIATRIGVCGFDLRGHGQSAGHPVHVEHWQDFSADLGCFIAKVRAGFPKVPLFLFGHSLGSLIVISHLIEHPTAVNGVILSGTAIDPVGVARPHKVALAYLFSFLLPKFPIPVRGKRRAVLSRDPRVEDDFAADPLVRRTATARFATEALAMISAVKRGAPSVTLPLLMIHGGADPLNTVAGALQFFEAARSPDKRLVVYPGSLHEPFHDLDRDQVLADLVSWIGEHS